MKVIQRYSVPVHGGWYSRELRGPLLHVGSRDPELVEFWAVYDDKFLKYRREFKVVGTDDDIPPNCVYHGSVVWRATVNHGDNVWHLISKLAP